MSLSWSWKGIPIPSVGVYILLSLFIIGLSVSVFILIVVHNAAFLLFFLLLSTFVICFIAWNMLNRNHKAALSLFVRSFPDSDLRLAPHGQLVKITGMGSPFVSLSFNSNQQYISFLLSQHWYHFFNFLTNQLSCHLFG